MGYDFVKVFPWLMLYTRRSCTVLWKPISTTVVYISHHVYFHNLSVPTPTNVYLYDRRNSWNEKSYTIVVEIPLEIYQHSSATVAGIMLTTLINMIFKEIKFNLKRLIRTVCDYIYIFTNFASSSNISTVVLFTDRANSKTAKVLNLDVYMI